MTQAAISIEREVLPNGLVLVTEHMPHMRSVAIGIWVRAGSRGEPVGLNGIAHFIEHMVFKGTSRRNAEQIAREMDSVGGLLDAFTLKEMGMEDDNPESRAHETLTQNFWRGHPLGAPILGTRATVRHLMRSSVVNC